MPVLLSFLGIWNLLKALITLSALARRRTRVVVNMAGHLSSLGKSNGPEPATGCQLQLLPIQRFLGKCPNQSLGFLMLQFGETIIMKL